MIQLINVFPRPYLYPDPLMAPEPVRLVSEPMPGLAFMLEMDSRPPKGLLLLPPETRRVRVDAEIALRKVSSIHLIHGAKQNPKNQLKHTSKQQRSRRQ